MKRVFTILFLFFVAVPLLAQNPDFDLKYKQAQSLFDKGQYEQARTSIRNALNKYPSLSAEQKAKGNKLVSQCNAAIENRDRLHLSVDELTIGYQSALDSIGYDAGKPNLISVTSSEPSWCKIERFGNGYIYVKSELNPEKTERRATVTVKMGKIKSATIQIIQQARPDTQKQLVIRTNPDRARISVDGGDYSTGIWEGTLASGKHRLRVEKNGFAVKDTVITILDDMRTDQQVGICLNLTPQFAKIRMDIQPEEGFSFGGNIPVITFNGVVADMNPREIYSYGDDRDIQRYSIYDDGTIPVSSGRLDIAVASQGFEPQQFEIQVRNGEEFTLSRVLKAITGYLTLEDVGNAQDAQVFVDNRPAGMVREYIHKRTIIGNHVITLQKDGFLSPQQEYSVSINEGENIAIPVKMARYVPYVFTSTPDNVVVTVDGVYVGNTPTAPYNLIEKDSGGKYLVEFTKENYLTVTREISSSFTNLEQMEEHADMLDTKPFQLKADRTDAKATILNRRKGDTVFVKEVALPAEISLPVRKAPYYIELRNVGETKKVYKKRFHFNNAQENTLNMQTYSRHNVHLLSGNYYLGGMPMVTIGGGTAPKEFKNMGNVSLIKFGVFPGFSTSAVRSGLFMGSDKTAPIIPSGDPTDGSGVTWGNFNYLPAISVLFINGEFRVGGYITDYLQVDAVATYAWYPDVIKNLIGFSHVVGHDLFLGGEVSTCIKAININFKMGMQMYPGGGLTANIYKGHGNTGTFESTSYVSLPIAGLPPSQFVISVGFTLGSTDAKGQNILRLFHIF